MSVPHLGLTKDFQMPRSISEDQPTFKANLNALPVLHQPQDEDTPEEAILFAVPRVENHRRVIIFYVAGGWHAESSA